MSCPVCGRVRCDHLPVERRQSYEEMMSDLLANAESAGVTEGDCIHTAYRCGQCGRMHDLMLSYCQACNHSRPMPVLLTAREYCSYFGHDGGETPVAGSAQKEGATFVPLVEDDGSIGGSDEPVFSHECLFRCVRCGFESRTRK